MAVMLSKILSQKDKIIEKVKQFGFSGDVLIGCGVPFFDNRNLFHIIVKKIEGVSLSYKAPTFLKAQLIDLLQCEVDVLVYDNVEKLYLETLDKTSASLDQEQEIEKLFNADVASINFLEANVDNVQKELLNRSNEHLKNNIPSEKKTEDKMVNLDQPNFFSERKRQSSLQEEGRENKCPRLMNESDQTLCLVIPLDNETQAEFLMKDKDFIDRIKSLFDQKLAEVDSKITLTSKI